MLGVGLRGFKHLHAPCQLPTTLSNRVARNDGTQLWPSSVWSISAVFGHRLEAVFQCHPSVAENRQKSAKVGHWTVTIFRVRALAGICNSQQGSHGPVVFFDKRNAETRDRGRLARERWPPFCALRRFAENLKSNHRQCNANGAKPRKAQNVRRPKGVAAAPANTLGQCRQPLKRGVKVLEAAKPDPQHLPAPAQPSVLTLTLERSFKNQGCTR